MENKPSATAHILATIAAIQADVPVAKMMNRPPPKRKPKAVRAKRKAQRDARKRNRR